MCSLSLFFEALAVTLSSPSVTLLPKISFSWKRECGSQGCTSSLLNHNPQRWDPCWFTPASTVGDPEVSCPALLLSWGHCSIKSRSGRTGMEREVLSHAFRGRKESSSAWRWVSFAGKLGESYATISFWTGEVIPALGFEASVWMVDQGGGA